MRLRSKWIAAFLVAATCVPLSSQEQGGDATFRVDTRLVQLNATVVDKNGKLIPDLPREAFAVTENGVAQQLKLFRREDVPVSMGLVIDNSGSMRERYSKVAAAAMRLVKASNPQDEVCIINFNDEAFLDVPFTSDLKKMEEGLGRVVTRGGTAMRDAVSMTIDYVKEKAKRDKKVLVVVTDGDDNTSSPSNTLEKLLTKASQSDEILLYFIGFLSDEERSRAKRAQRAMTSLAEATGGYAYFPKEIEEIEQLADKVAHEIRNQYTLAYSPTNQSLDGSYRRIVVTAKGNNKPVVRTRSGYYATPDEKAPRNAPRLPTGNSLNP